METVKYKFKEVELKPHTEVYNIVQKDSVLSYFVVHTLLVETYTVVEKELPMVIAEPVKKKLTKTSGEENIEDVYSISYYDPESGKTEYIQKNEHIRITDPSEKVIERAMASNSLYPVYDFIAQPLVVKQVDPVKLQQILDSREYGTPPKFGGPAVVKQDVKKSEIVAYEKAAELAILRKEEEEKKTLQEIITFDAVIRNIEKGEDIEEVLSKLPPLSRARYLLLLRKKKISRKMLLKMLLKDLNFLNGIRKKLIMFSIDDLGAILSLVKLSKKKK